MKRLTLIRHAKSSWKYNVSDKERPLKGRGYNDAILVSKWLKLKGLEVDAVFSSPANRALTTCNLFLETLNISEENLSISENIYDFGGLNLTQFIKSIPDEFNNIMVFGHNHAITSFVNNFGTEYFDNVPTCGLVIIDFEVKKWGNLIKGKTVNYMFPKMLKT